MYSSTVERRLSCVRFAGGWSGSRNLAEFWTDISQPWLVCPAICPADGPIATELLESTDPFALPNEAPNNRGWSVSSARLCLSASPELMPSRNLEIRDRHAIFLKLLQSRTSIVYVAHMLVSEPEFTSGRFVFRGNGGVSPCGRAGAAVMSEMSAFPYRIFRGPTF